MNVLVYTDVVSWEMHVATTVEIINKHIEKGDKVFFVTREINELKCLPHNNSFCKHCVKQSNYIFEKIFQKKIFKVDIKLQKKFDQPTFSSIEEILKFKYEKMPIGELVMSSITDENRQVFNNLISISNRISLLINAGINLYKEICELIDNEKIDIVYSWNGRRATTGPVLYAGIKKNIKFYSYMTGGTLSTYVAQPTTMVHDLNYGKKRLKELYEEYYEKGDDLQKNFFISDAKKFYNYLRYGGEKIWGYPFYKDLFDNKIPLEKKSKKKILTIFTSTYYEFYALGIGFRKKKGKDINHYEILKQILSSPYILENYDIRIRWHPNLSFAGELEITEIKKIIENTKKKTIHYSPFHKVDPYKLLNYSDVIISFGSTIGIEATYYGKASILWGAAFYEDTGGVYEVDSLLDLENLLSRNIEPKPKINSLKYAFFERNKGEYSYQFIKYDKNDKYYFNNMRVYRPTFLQLVTENAKIILKFFGIVGFGRKIFYYISKILRRKSSGYTPLDW